MNLDITKDSSNFYSTLLLSRDSLFNAEFSKVKGSHIIDLRKIKRSNVGFRISKKYPDFRIIYHTSINADNFAIKEPDKINWAILPETNIIEGFKVQKAITELGGRKWTAWFTPDIPFQEGPYKFCGLPGLILNIEDEKGDHIFKFKGSEKLNDNPVFYELKRKEIYVTEEKFNQLWNEFKKDPAKIIKQIHGSSELSDTIFSDPNGNPLTKQDLIRNKEQAAQQYFKHYNNFIEIKLYR